MIFPISDDDRALLRPAYVTWFLLAGNVLLYIYQIIHPEFTYAWSVVPQEITTGIDLVEPVMVGTGSEAGLVPQHPGPSPIYLTILSAMFMHGGLAHLGGNMLYLWIFGDNVEHRFGSLKFLLFYLVSGIVATFAQIILAPDSVIPNLGASGAIAGILGAYLVLFPRNKVKAVFFFRIISIPAILVLGMWIVMQFVSGAGTLQNAGQTGGVAYAAHIGGFVAGVVMGLIARFTMKTEPDSGLLRQYRHDDSARKIW